MARLGSTTMARDGALPAPLIGARRGGQPGEIHLLASGPSQSRAGSPSCSPRAEEGGAGDLAVAIG